MTDSTPTKKINLGSSNHPDNFVTEEEFADIVAEAVAAGEEEKARKEEEAECAAGTCDHYVCTGGRSLDEWDEPEPTAWDYNSEAFAGEGDDEWGYEHTGPTDADLDNEAAAKKGEAK